MSNIQHTRGVLSLRAVTIAVLSLGFAVTASLPATARVGVAVQPNWHRQENAQDLRYFNYAAPIEPGLTYVPNVPRDSCDLPSAGCQSYLSN
jgi:hypothetical protein